MATGRQRIHVDQLQVGVHIHLTENWRNHPFLFSSFKIRKQDQIEALKAAGVEFVDWDADRSDRPPSDRTETSRPEPRPAPTPAATTRLRNTLGRPPPTPDSVSKGLRSMVKPARCAELTEKTQRVLHSEPRYTQGIRQVREMMQKAMVCSDDTVEHAQVLVKDLLGTLLVDDEAGIHLVNSRKDHDAVSHALNVTILAVMLGRAYGLRREQIEILGCGALFHDIGKQALAGAGPGPQDPSAKPGEDLLRRHPWSGEALVAGIRRFAPDSIRVIRQHHETRDGRGYPDGLKGNEIALLSLLAAIPNLYDNYCNPGRPEEALTPHQACARLYAQHRDQYGDALIALFVRTVGVYPPGTVVELSDGRLGLVLANGTRTPLRPTILAYNPGAATDPPVLMELEAQPELLVRTSVHPRDLPEAMREVLSPELWGQRFLKDMGN
jgi:HD-GYP domain-containing protein (c-di-GMP phosphodiesterase class II)